MFFSMLAQNELFRGNDLLSYLDVAYWDGTTATPPACSTYLYWSTQCGAIGSSWAKSCSGGGSRVFSDSCVTHFNSGSAGCGFLGCKSLCYNFNLNGCSCDALRYEVERETEYTNPAMTTSQEAGVDSCRRKCSGAQVCVGFSVSPTEGSSYITCKTYSALTTKRSNTSCTTFKLNTSSSNNANCSPLSDGSETPWPASVMADDIAFGERLTNEYQRTTTRKRAPDSVDRRNNVNYATTIKDQSGARCGLCAPVSFTSAVEGTHKVWKGGYTGSKDLSPVWVGRCKAQQSCDNGAKGGQHITLLNAVGNSYIHLESCNPLSTAANPNCGASCSGVLPYITNHKSWNFLTMNPDATTRNRYLAEIQEWLATTGPIMAGICAGAAWDAYRQMLQETGSSEAFYQQDNRWKGLPACGTCNHAITVVGYRHEMRAGKQRLVWIIQNSYGKDYGNKGYQFIEHGSAAINKAIWYGVQVNENHGEL
ncbi:hypothetical protein FS749_002958 [Ceratobasidium sp. UAMH 11750]|nr:hypothetical protein FS749_002958 [Ceratobasidium sp. UAMH 11750]